MDVVVVVSRCGGGGEGKKREGKGKVGHIAIRTMSGAYAGASYPSPRLSGKNFHYTLN